MLLNNTQQTCHWILIVVADFIQITLCVYSFAQLIYDEKYEIIKNYVSLVVHLMFIYCLHGFKIYLLRENISLFALKLSAAAAVKRNRSGLFVFHHVHRVYLISVSLFCLFNVAFSGLVCVSASDVLQLKLGWEVQGSIVWYFAHCQLTWNFSTSSIRKNYINRRVNKWTVMAMFWPAKRLCFIYT